MAINRQERAAERLRARQEYAAHREEQARINAEAEESGAGGIVITDERPKSRMLVESSRKAASGPSENKSATAAEDDDAPAKRTAAKNRARK